MNETQHLLTNSMLFSSLEINLNSLRKGLNALYNGETSEAVGLSHLLRTLVCRTTVSDGLLWRVIDKVQSDDQIAVPDMVKILEETPDNNELALIILLMDHGKWQKNGIPLEIRSLKDYIRNGEAIRAWLRDHKTDKYELKISTPGEVIRAVADKISSHVDVKVSDFFAKLAALKMGETSALVHLIASYSMLVAEVGERALIKAESQGYERRKDVIDLPTTSLFHAALSFDLDVPEMDMPENRHRRIPLRMESYHEAIANRPPFRIGGDLRVKVQVEIWVGHSLGIEVFVYFNSLRPYRFVFRYPSLRKSVFILDVTWDEKSVAAHFEGETKSWNFLHLI